MLRSRIALFSVGALAAGLLAAVPASAGHLEVTGRVEIPGLGSAASVVRDVDGVPHLRAANEHDLFFLQGWVHAEDRLFQMDVTRRRGAGTLAELIGGSALPSDVQSRTLGIRRVAERTLPVLSAQTRAAMRAYAEGVNAWIARNPLPEQYASVQMTRVEPWTPLDSMVVSKTLAFSLSFDLDIDRTTAVQSYTAAGLDGHKAVVEDLFPFAGFTTASPVSDSTGRPANPGGPTQPVNVPGVAEAVARMAAEYLERAEESPLIVQALNRHGDRGSNSWVIGGRHTANGRPLLASDPHLAAEFPATLHPIDLQGAGFDIQGDSLPGTPYVILGQNRHIAYGATQHFVDVSDTYIEQIRPDAASPSGLSTVYQGRLEPVVAIDETFRVNPRTPGQRDVLNIVPAGGAIPAKTLIVPRRNNGPLLTVDTGAGTALSVQFAGFSPTTELEAFRRINLARNLDEFRTGLQFFDLGGQHFIYADLMGNIAYITNAEVPIREDLQAGEVRGNPPYLLRNGTGGNEWLPVTNRQPNQSLPYEILPAGELPQVVNPPAGFVVSANNDPTGNTFDNNVLNQVRPGGGISYLSFFHSGYRAGRITDMVRAAVRKGRVTTADIIGMQADVTAIDGQFFTPLITGALDRARRSATPELAELARDRRIAEAAGRLGRWRHTYPTGIPQGYDANDRDGRLGTPSQQEIEESVAATIYALWRGRFVINALDRPVRQISTRLPLSSDFHAVQALKQLLVDFDTRQGVGRSGIDFFAVPGIASAADRRDFLILTSLGEALTLAAGDNFRTAFGNSTNQNDYRWGKLHRLTLPSPIGAPFTVPSEGNRFTSPLPGLPGIPFDGGYFVPDVSSHAVRADAPDRFTVPSVPVNRRVVQAAGDGWRAVNSLAGGAGERPGSPYEQNLLPGWLTNDTYPVRSKASDLLGAVDSVTVFLPARRE
ncbi:MAG TPA: penicillin acylase family protein [Candidatus Limnocylindrales bacterium]